MATKTNGAGTLPARQSPPTSQAPARVTPANDFRKLIEGSEDRLRAILPKHMTPERIIRLSLAAYNRKTELHRCSALSILNAIIQSSQLGLEADSPLGHAYLVPYGDACTFQIGYKGFIELARRSQAYRVIEAVEVFEKDVFSFYRDPQPRVEHRPSLDDNPGKMTHVYAYAILASGDPIVEMLPRSVVEKIRGASKSKNSLMWNSYFGEGAKKTAIKRLLKRQPMTIEMADAVTHDDSLNGDERIEDGRHQTSLPRGTAGLKTQLAPPAPEPEFDVEAGVDRPVYSEPDDLLDEMLDAEEDEGRMTGEDG